MNTTASVINCSSSNQAPVKFLKSPPKKNPAACKRATQEQQYALSPPCKRQRLRRQRLSLSWAPTLVHSNNSNRHLGDDFDPKDIWYTRGDYDCFLDDRLRTVKFLRATGGDDSLLDQQNNCLRGLEPFQTEQKHKHLLALRQFHQGTILLEQVRQIGLGIREPERFRVLVASMSEVALKRAQELAVKDEEEVYRKVDQQLPPVAVSSIFSMLGKSVLPSLTGTTTTAASAGITTTNLSTPSVPESLQRLQQLNAKRLLQLSRSSCNYNGRVFQSQIQRDSMLGGNRANTTNTTANSVVDLIRNDSLSSLKYRNLR